MISVSVLDQVLAPLRAAKVPEEAFPDSFRAFYGDDDQWHSWAACPTRGRTGTHLDVFGLAPSGPNPCATCVGRGPGQHLPADFKRFDAFVGLTVFAISTGTPTHVELRNVRSNLKALSSFVLPSVLDQWRHDRLAELRARREELKLVAAHQGRQDLAWSQVARHRDFPFLAVRSMEAVGAVGSEDDPGGLDQLLGQGMMELFVEDWARYCENRDDALRPYLAAADFVSSNIDCVTLRQLPPAMPERHAGEGLHTWLERGWRDGVLASYEAWERFLVARADDLAQADPHLVLIDRLDMGHRLQGLDPAAPELDDGRALLRVPGLLVKNGSYDRAHVLAPEGSAATILETAHALVPEGDAITSEVLAQAAALED